MTDSGFRGGDEVGGGGISRRRLLWGAAGAGLAGAFGGAGTAAQTQADGAAPSFTFVHVTDCHIQPEQGAARGVRRCFEAVRALRPRPAFVLVGGDIVMGSAQAAPGRADALYALWREAEASLGLPVHYSVGNADLLPVTGGGSPSDPAFGKAGWMRRLGLERRHDSFEHGGWRFVTLDSVRAKPDGSWVGEIDAEQVKWLDDLLRKTPREQPVAFLTHVPVMTLYGLYTGGTTAPLSESMIVKNGKEFKELIQGRNVKAVFQGHTHVVEECAYLGTRYITGGAVCGDWWKGPRLGVHPEGFGVVTVKGEQLDYRYVSYGWKAAGSSEGSTA